MPSIVAPVMRVLRSADVSRSAAFYRDVLGFTIREIETDGYAPIAEAVSGPARIQFGRDDSLLETASPLGRQSSIVFFATDDVEGMHAAIAGRGGAPGNIEDVNWIKMRVFEVRDPDGHTLWFGQSFDEPHAQVPRPMFAKIMPELPQTDVAAAVAHYRDVLGFSINYQQHNLGVMDRDDVRVLLIARSERPNGIGSAYVYVENADALHAELRAKGAAVQGDPVSQPWGLREFRVLDLEGNQITFGQPFE